MRSSNRNRAAGLWKRFPAAPHGNAIRRLAASVLIVLLWFSESRGDEERPRVPLLSHAEAWKLLPECQAGRGEPLPAWARALAASLPQTTAAMLDLDGLYRTTTELDPRLRAKLRWAAARANRCRYTQEHVAADFLRAGGQPAELERLAEGIDHLPAEEQAAIQFARQMTTEASAVTDEDVARLIEHYGEKAVVAMVLQLAYANFQDRLILTLGLPPEENGPLPPASFRFTVGEIPQAPRPEELPMVDDAPAGEPDPAAAGGEQEAWSALELPRLRDLLAAQRDRPGRVSIPDWESVRAVLPDGSYPPGRELKIRWSLVVLGHQPELGMAWMRCMRNFGRESGFDQVLAESMFWVITRTIHCFY